MHNYQCNAQSVSVPIWSFLEHLTKLQYVSQTTKDASNIDFIIYNAASLSF